MALCYVLYWFSTESAYPYTSSCYLCKSWWRHQMETFSALLAICAGNSPVNGEVPTQRPVTRNFDVFFDLRPNKRLSKQSWGWWFETPSCPLWRHCNVFEQVFSFIYHRCVRWLPQMSLPKINQTLLWFSLTLQWRYNERDDVSNHRRLDCWFNCLFKHRSKKTSDLRATGLCDRNPPVIGEFTSQTASNAENVSIWWHHQGEMGSIYYGLYHKFGKTQIEATVASIRKLQRQ